MCSLLTVLLQTTRSQLPCFTNLFSKNGLSVHTAFNSLQHCQVLVDRWYSRDSIANHGSEIGPEREKISWELFFKISCSCSSQLLQFFYNLQPIWLKDHNPPPQKSHSQHKKRLCFKSSQVNSYYFLSNFRYTALSHGTFYKNL